MESFAEFDKEEAQSLETFRRNLLEYGDDIECMTYDEEEQGLLKHDERTGEKMIGNVYIPARELCPQHLPRQLCRFGAYCLMRHTYAHLPLENPDLVRPEGDAIGQGMGAFDEEAD